MTSPDSRLPTRDLLFIHSLGGRGDFWDDVRTKLGAGVHSHAFDLRGHGSARGASGGFTLDDFADDVLAAASAAFPAAFPAASSSSPAAFPAAFSSPAAFPAASRSAAVLSCGRFMLIGHSFGALVALAVAARAPERVAALALVDAAGAMNAVPAQALEDFLASASGPSGAEFVADAYRQNLERAKPTTSERVLASLADTDQAALVGAYTALFGTDPLALLARYPGPVRLIVDSANDSPMSLHAQHHDLDVVPVEGTSHWINLDQPAALADALRGGQPREA